MTDGPTLGSILHLIRTLEQASGASESMAICPFKDTYFSDADCSFLWRVALSEQNCRQQLQRQTVPLRDLLPCENNTADSSSAVHEASAPGQPVIFLGVSSR